MTQLNIGFAGAIYTPWTFDLKHEALKLSRTEKGHSRYNRITACGALWFEGPNRQNGKLCGRTHKWEPVINYAAWQEVGGMLDRRSAGRREKNSRKKKHSTYSKHNNECVEVNLEAGKQKLSEQA